MSSNLLDIRYCQEQIASLKELISEKYVSGMIGWSIANLKTELESIAEEAKFIVILEQSGLHLQLKELIDTYIEMCEYELG